METEKESPTTLKEKEIPSNPAVDKKEEETKLEESLTFEGEDAKKIISKIGSKEEDWLTGFSSKIDQGENSMLSSEANSANEFVPLSDELKEVDNFDQAQFVTDSNILDNFSGHQFMDFSIDDSRKDQW